MSNPSIEPADTYDAISIASSDVSTTSTEMFEHEPFETFQTKVIELCKQNWPQLATNAFRATRMEGGSYNRVLEIQVDTSKKQLTWIQRHAQRLSQKVCPSSQRKSKIRKYVIRIPRYEHAWVEHEVSLLHLLAETKIPVPKVTSFSLLTDNEVGSPFTIQPRLPGKSVVELYLDMNTQQRISFARELGSAISEVGKLRSPCPGSLDPNSILNGLSNIQVLRLQCPPRNAFRPGSGEPFTYSTPQSVYEFLTSQFARQREYDLSLHREHTNPWKPFALIIGKLNEQGLFNDNTYHLTHMDFEPRNILIDITSPTTAHLSAILDWDEAVFAPSFVNCRPPSWLWDFEGDEDLDESLADVMPTDPDLQAVKKSFEDAVGPEYLTYAYSTEYRIARNICRLAITGFHSNDEYDVAEKVVDDWNEMMPECRVCGLFEAEDDHGDD